MSQHKKAATATPALLKIVILGPGGVGKSAITSQYVRSFFTKEYDPTIEDSYMKNTFIDGIPVKLDILDTAGQEQFTTMREQYIRDGDGFFLVFSLTDFFTFNEMNGFHRQITMVKNRTDFPMMLIGNKSDLEPVVSSTEAMQVAQKFEMEFMAVSAKEALNVEEAFCQLVRKIRKFKEANAPTKKNNGFCNLL